MRSTRLVEGASSGERQSSFAEDSDLQMGFVVSCGSWKAPIWNKISYIFTFLTQDGGGEDPWKPYGLISPVLSLVSIMTLLKPNCFPKRSD